MGCTEAHTADTTAEPPREACAPMPKVMVVDDAYSELQVMETILRSAGYDVVTYLDGDQLEAKIVKEQPYVVLLDIVMSKRNGFEALRGVRREVRYEQARHIVSR